jgi:SAM-dependent methyltransferase
MMINYLRQWLYEPKVRGVNVDDNALLDIHTRILQEKPLLRSAFQTFYEDMAFLCDKYFLVSGDEIELGTGAGFFKRIRPGLITSDVRKAPQIDMELDAQAMALPDNSVRCIYAINVFHHLPDPDRGFRELQRVLCPGGGCILIEPHIGVASATLHRYLHSNERFNPNAEGWQTSDIEGPLSGANQALAYVVFQRDRTLFQEKYGNNLEIVHEGYELNALRYLLSGGLNFRQAVPSFLETSLKLIERFAKPLAKYWTLHQIIVIRKHGCFTKM